MKMNEMMGAGIIWLVIGLTLFVIGLVGYGIDYYITKKISHLSQPCEHGYIEIDKAGVRVSLRNITISEDGGSLIAIDGSGNQHLLIGKKKLVNEEKK